MRTKRFLTSGVITAFLLVLMTGLAVAQAPDATPLGTGFTYQGQLNSDGSPYSGSCDFLFGLYDAAMMGTSVGELTVTSVSVSEGMFTTQLDFGSDKFTGDNRWLEIWVRCPAGSGTYQVLLPRQPLTASPYALYASTAGEVPWSGISSLPAGFADGVDNVGWSLTGNSGTIPGTNYIGTSDNQPLEIKVNNLRVFRFEPYTVSPNLIGGHSANAIISGVYGATISGGGASDAPNIVTDQYGTIGGGVGNQAGDGDTDPANKLYTTVSGGANNIASGDNATISGGYGNSADGFLSFIGGGTMNSASGEKSTIGGGDYNQATGQYSAVFAGYQNWAVGSYSTTCGGGMNHANANFSTVCGGNVNIASGEYSFTGGGSNNQATGQASTISGGDQNNASAVLATIGGGSHNSASDTGASIGGGSWNTASSDYAVVGGGNGNTASGEYSTVGGGVSNVGSGNKSFVGGGDSNGASGAYSMIPGGFYNVAAGDYSFAAGKYAAALYPGCFVWADSSSSAYTYCGIDNAWLARASGGVYFFTNSGETTGSYLVAGGSSWNSLSSRDAKENFTPLDSEQLLENLAKVPITTWNYKEQDSSIVHVGLMADEFNSLITGLGGEGKDYINSMDAVGVSLAAIQGLYAENLDLKAQLANQQSQINSLESRLIALEAGGSVSAGLSTNAVPWMLLFGLFSISGLCFLNRRCARSK